ncbi:hypothetical protein F9L69_14400 [Brucella melitensis]|uniref:Uncharacterized protein n=1 Tax=Brucella melitensis biotype 1 (strain ATCC 23456 / CCUG 17765 / NCTC 10094 / 16M) TaxID=224914 RepID=Q8YCG8_BRUME|nr:hypothetical protein BMEII0562 [Brucella melitensis bv. 1 str. 16M]ATV15411.1 hypothetical protein CT124_13370 [Brucella melitensis]EEZ09769.1 predicted protein [Brucella melitensis bv. 3 str. Ether]EEZ13381.1 predicted protein [Brucella melitensis bv. 1 str. Rev.1]EEZ16393.1 predicted protein [Brucella melitensis bv. 2 str. 63/9]RTQ42007.1 hypothetical protein EJW28_05825 [Brucella abortus]
MALSAFGSRNRRVSRSVSGRAKRKTRNDFHWIVDRAAPVLTESPEPLYLFVFSTFGSKMLWAVVTNGNVFGLLAANSYKNNHNAPG